MQNRYVFDLGNSNSDPVGFCASVHADSAEDAVAKLKTMIQDREAYMGTDFPIDPSGEDYLIVFINKDVITEDDIDYVEEYD